MFKLGDFVAIKPNTALESGIIVSDWAGEITALFKEEGTCNVTLDAQTLNGMSDAYLQECIDEYADPYEYIFDFSDLVISQKRGTNHDLATAIKKVDERTLELETSSHFRIAQKAYINLQMKWVDEFSESDFIDSFSDDLKKDATFIPEAFMHYMFGYATSNPQEWNTANVGYICLEVLPRKITVEIETFENCSEILSQFFEFLASKNYISNAKELIGYLESIKEQIPIEAANPDNWGMAKSMLMEAKNQGVDLSDQASIVAFFKKLESGENLD